MSIFILEGENEKLKGVVILVLVAIVSSFGFLITLAQLGYEDTPFLPGQKWRVHDSKRPQPMTVIPAQNYGDPPSDAVILFDGKDLSKWKSAWTGGSARWKVEDGYMEIVPRTGDIQTVDEFGDCQLHIEWCIPENVQGSSQSRGNSGVFLMGRYEIQILDSFENKTYADGMAAAIYGQYPPLVNASRRPSEWQTYDIIWIAPRFDGDKLVRPGYLTLIHNGVIVHYHTPVIGPTRHRSSLTYKPHPPVGPLRLQDHGFRVRFRNIWYRPLKGYDGEPEWRDLTPFVFPNLHR
ncbi:MAG: DUF1080 domain-containing protein [Armatimonadetes bacterium]|nr:DUF1080 domain-containing protein [Armatimonadota bacterium]